MGKMTPMKAIRAKCIDCCGGHIYEPRHCTAEKCPLHPYRMGHKPKRINDTAGHSSTSECGATPTDKGIEKENE